MKSTDLAAARGRTIPDVLPGPDDPSLRVLFCGINPGLVSAATGHHFARPGNRFWPVLHGAGFTPRLLRPDEQQLLPGLGLGITNIVSRASARADELSVAELVTGGAQLRDLVRDWRPAALGVVGITAYRVAFAAPRATVGQQPALGATLVWALPNPSGLNAHWSLPAMVAEFARFRLAAAVSDPFKILLSASRTPQQSCLEDARQLCCGVREQECTEVDGVGGVDRGGDVDNLGVWGWAAGSSGLTGARCVT